MAAAVAESTFKTYCSGLSKYIKFCTAVGITKLFPLSEYTLELFVSFCGDHLAVATIKVYLFALQFFSIRLGFYEPKIANMHSLHYIIRGLKRLQGDSFSRKQRLPFTVTSLSILCAHITKTFSYRNGVMLKAAVLVAFFGLLRSAEYCCPTIKLQNPTVHLQYRDIDVDYVSGVIKMSIKASKTDPFKTGAVVRICRTGSDLCPFSALITLLGIHPTLTGPLFVFEDCTYLTRGRLAKIVKDVFPRSCNLDTHSFRIGGATAACALGFSEGMIKELGRWKSDCYKKYIKLPDKYISHAQKQMLAFVV